MGLFTDGIKAITTRVETMREEYLTMSANYKNLETNYEKFLLKYDQQMEKMKLENEDIRRRVTTLEGVINATLKTAMKEAVQNIAREHIEKKSSVDGINDAVRLFLGENESENEVN